MLRRVLRLTGSLIGLVVVSFLLVRLIPGDPVITALGHDATAEQQEALRHQLGLDLPLWEQFVRYITQLAHGDLGQSIFSQRDVLSILADRVPASLLLGAIGFAVTFVVAITLGFMTAVLTHGGRRRWLEIAFTATTSFFAALPDFFVAIVLVLVFGLTLHLLPVAGMSGPNSFVLPVIALIIVPTAALAKVARVETNEVLDSDYLLTARSKYLPEHLVLIRHALPNMLTSSLAIGGYLLAGMLVGSVFVERVFSWPGAGEMAVGSIIAKDYPVVTAFILYYGVIVIVITAIVDAIIAMLNPRSLALE